MSNFDLKQQPHYELKTIDTDEEITYTDIQPLVDMDSGVTLCVRSKNGHINRGGYFFCVIKVADDSYQLETIEGDIVDVFTSKQLVCFINHASGKKFESEMLDYCQNSINFRAD